MAGLSVMAQTFIQSVHPSFLPSGTLADFLRLACSSRTMFSLPCFALLCFLAFFLYIVVSLLQTPALFLLLHSSGLSFELSLGVQVRETRNLTGISHRTACLPGLATFSFSALACVAHLLEEQGQCPRNGWRPFLSFTLSFEI